MKSSAATVEQYLASLPEDRRSAVSTVRDFILDHLGSDFEECMQYGVIGYVVPHRVWPQGHHTNPKLPLMYMGLSSQKNDMVVYMLFLLHNKPEREWFDAAWKATGKKNYLEVSGAGCCLRFRKVEELSLGVIGEAMRRMPATKYLQDHAAMLARLGRASTGTGAKPSSANRGGAKKAPASKKSAPLRTTKPAKKKTASKRG
ncbi:MAG: DUF1801 domain-containing protein [Phycisphaerales bacterium]